VVIAVLGATRPAQPRRRRPPVMRRREGKPGSKSDLMSERVSPDPSHRNRWDRVDIAMGVGRDYAHPDVTLTLWPESGSR
jgi:hypothetical protein